MLDTSQISCKEAQKSQFDRHFTHTCSKSYVQKEYKLYSMQVKEKTKKSVPLQSKMKQ